jgi:hypothetical protein
MKQNSLFHDTNAGVIGNISLLLLIAVIGGGGYWLLNGGLTSIIDSIGDQAGNWVDNLIGAAAGGVSALFTGKKGIFTSLNTIKSKSKINPFNWF